MKHLGGKWFCMVYVEWFPGGLPVDWHLWMATQKQRDQRFLQVKMLPVQPRIIWALSRSTKLCGLSPDRQVWVEVYRWSASGQYGVGKCFRKIAS